MRWPGRRKGGGPSPDEVRLPFADRQEAGRLLARRLAAEALPPTTLVLGIPRGGVPVAAEVAAALGLELDVLVAHKVGAPGNPEFAIGAAAADGTTLVASWAAELGEVSVPSAEQAAGAEVERAREREQVLRAGRPPLTAAGRVVVIIDDGIATGATIEVAARSARRAGAARILIATPVAAPGAAGRLRSVADRIIVLAEPASFFAVGQWYIRFDQLDDEDVAAILAAADRPRSAGGEAPEPPGEGA